MKRKTISIVLVLLVVFSVCGCSFTEKTDASSEFQNTDAEVQTTHNGTITLSSENETESTTEYPTEATNQELINETTSVPVDTIPTPEDPSEPQEDHAALTQKQANSIAMLNYLAMISQKIESAKDTHNSRLLLEEVYSALLNNTSPDKLDEKSQFHLTNLLDIIEDYRMISIKRDRLQFLYDQDKAATIREAVPNPLAVLSVSNALNWKRLVASVAYTALDSYNRYKKANSEIDKQFMISGWELDDEEAANIHKNRKRAFNYMVEIVREYDLPGDLALSEEAIQNFVTHANSDNVHQQLQFFEARENVYQGFGEYWLVLIDCYYEIENYKSVLDCVTKYESLYTGIFRKDYSYAERLPKAIVAAQHVYAEDTYVDVISAYTDAIKENAGESDWSLRYFAAQSYLDLFEKTHDNAYLQAAYSLALDNVNLLVDEQIKMNNTYVNELVELQMGKLPEYGGYSKEEQEARKKQQKEEQKRLDALNESLEEKRETELPSLYEPLVLNCELLFALSEELNISDSEKARIEGILRSATNGVFLTKPVNERYAFSHHSQKQYEATIEQDIFILPADILCENCEITATVVADNGTTVFNDWVINEVERTGEDVSSFLAYCYSEQMDSYTWSEGAIISIEISYNGVCDPVFFKFEVTEYSHRIWPISDKVVFTRL